VCQMINLILEINDTDPVVQQSGAFLETWKVPFRLIRVQNYHYFLGC